jgi:hypothetical protein
MKKYKLIKEYPGSPELGVIVGGVDSSTFYFYENPDLCRIVIRKTLVDNKPEYWEEINDNNYMVSLTDMAFRNAWEVIEVRSINYKETDSKKFFKTEEEAEHFILYNKPCLSMHDILERYGYAREFGKNNITFYGSEETLKEIIKSKL